VAEIKKVIELEIGTAIASRGGMRSFVGVSGWVIGVVAAMNMIAIGCGGGQAWPRVRGATSQQFVAQPSTVRTVDVMPVDVQLWTYRGSKTKPAKIAHEFADASTLAINDTMAKRGYYIASNIDWDGNYVGYNGRLASAMPGPQVQRTAEALSSYGTATKRARGRMLQPHLPHRLGAATQSDATLYVGGWAFVGKTHKKGSTAGNVAKGVLIALVIVLIVAVIVAAIAGKGKGGGGLGRLASGAGKVAKGVGQVAVRTARTVGRAGIHVTKAVAKGMVRGSRGLSRTNWNIDIYNRPRTHVDYYYQRPNYFVQKTSPRKGRSAMMVEMVLIDNRTGQPLWHANQRFPANATNRKQVQAVFRDMLSTLPSRYRVR